MMDRSILVADFVRQTLDALDAQIESGGPCTYFVRAPRYFRDADIEAAAQALHDAGRVCMVGLSHSGSKYTSAFVAFRICMPECFAHYREAQARNFVWLTGFVCALLTALACFIGEWALPGNFWPAMGAAAACWAFGAWLIRKRQVALAHLQMPTGPVHEWISYG